MGHLAYHFMYPRDSVMLVLAFSMEIVKYGSNFWKYKKWYNYQTLCPLFISHSASLNFVDPSFPSTKFLLSLRNFSSASHSISQLFVLSVCSSLMEYHQILDMLVFLRVPPLLSFFILLNDLICSYGLTSTFMSIALKS